MSSARTSEALQRKREELRLLSSKLKDQKKSEERKAKAKASAELKRRNQLWGQGLARALQSGRVDSAVVDDWLDQAISREKDRAFLGLSSVQTLAATQITPVMATSNYPV